VCARARTHTRTHERHYRCSTPVRYWSFLDTDLCMHAAVFLLVPVQTRRYAVGPIIYLVRIVGHFLSAILSHGTWLDPVRHRGVVTSVVIK
jgi:hypothetical protein